jgi:hypothetical protein
MTTIARMFQAMIGRLRGRKDSSFRFQVERKHQATRRQVIFHFAFLILHFSFIRG